MASKLVVCTHGSSLYILIYLNILRVQSQWSISEGFIKGKNSHSGSVWLLKQTMPLAPQNPEGVVQKHQHVQGWTERRTVREGLGQRKNFEKYLYFGECGLKSLTLINKRNYLFTYLHIQQRKRQQDESRNTGASLFSFMISVLGSFTCITQHTEPTALRPIRRTKQLWLSILLKDTITATGQAGIRTHTRTWVQRTRPLSHDTPQIVKINLDLFISILMILTIYYRLLARVSLFFQHIRLMFVCLFVCLLGCLFVCLCLCCCCCCCCCCFVFFHRRLTPPRAFLQMSSALKCSHLIICKWPISNVYYSDMPTGREIWSWCRLET